MKKLCFEKGITMNYGIIFEGEASPLVNELSDALSLIGLYRAKGNTLTPEMLDALNIYRTSNDLAILDFCDPSTLRTLGIDADGDEILLLARYGSMFAETELGIFDACNEIVTESIDMGISIAEAINRCGVLGKLHGDVSKTAVTAAALALLHK